MVKRTIKETMREYDSEGRLTMETITETQEEDDCGHIPPVTYPSNPNPTITPYITCDAAKGVNA